MVFHHPRKLAVLNRIVHPRVAREQVRQTNVIARQHPNAVIIYDAALLIEARAHERMDRIIVVTANQPIQIQRARQRDDLTKKEALARIRAQLPLRTKRRFADYVLNGTSPIARLRPQGTTTLSGVSSRSGHCCSDQASRVTPDYFLISHEG